MGFNCTVILVKNVFLCQMQSPSSIQVTRGCVCFCARVHETIAHVSRVHVGLFPQFFQAKFKRIMNRNLAQSVLCQKSKLPLLLSAQLCSHYHQKTPFPLQLLFSFFLRLCFLCAFCFSFFLIISFFFL